MPITLADGDDKKFQRILDDVNAARGSAFSEKPTKDELLNTAYQLVGNNGTEAQILARLQQAALNKLLVAGKGETAYNIHRDLFYMGYVDTPPVGADSPEDRTKKAEQAINKFLEKHPECQGLSAKDMMDKITDTLWYEKKQPGAASNAEKWGGSSYSMGEGGGGYYQGLYADFDDAIGNEVQASANASFGGPDAVKKVQALLYMRYPKAFDTNNNDSWHGLDRRPDGKWTMYDQQLLQRFIDEENRGIYKDNPIPPPTAMRWGGSDAAHASDIQKEYGSRIIAGLVNSEVTLGLGNLQKTAKADQINPANDGSIKMGEIAQMQLYLKAGGYYTSPQSPTGVWTMQDKQALQRWLDDSNHRRSGFAHFFGFSDEYPHSTDNMSGDDFRKILDAAKKESEDKYGITPDMVGLLTQNKPVQEPETPNLSATTAPKKDDPVTTTPPNKTTDPKTTAPATPLPVNSNVSKIADGGIGQMEARLFLMGYGGNTPIDGTEASLKAMIKNYAVKKQGVKADGRELTEAEFKAAAEGMTNDWYDFANAHAKQIKEAVDKGAAVSDNHKKDPNVLQMQTILLAMGGSFSQHGLDGIKWDETRGALDAVASPDGDLGKLMAANGLTASWLKPSATSPTTSTSTDNKPPATDPNAVPIMKENHWVTQDYDVFGDGGFIKPYTPPPDPQVTPQLASKTGDVGKQFTDASTANTNGNTTPVVTGTQPGTTTTTPGQNNLPPRGQTSAYFNQNAQSDLGSATRFFSTLTAPYVYDSPKTQGCELYTLPLGGKDHNQGMAFLYGPDHKYAAVYNVNGNVDPRTLQYVDPATGHRFDAQYGSVDGNPAGMPLMTYAKVYDLTTDEGKKEFNKVMEEAADRQRQLRNKLETNPGIVTSMPPPVRIGIINPIGYERPREGVHFFANFGGGGHHR